MLGSHSDTVPSGGRFDGPAGILAALEVVRAMQAAGYKPRHAIEVVDFLAEEPSEYGVSCVGSRAMAGALDDKLLAFTERGRREARGCHSPRRRRSEQARAGAALGHGGLSRAAYRARRACSRTTRIDLGLVTAIVGIIRIEIEFQGAADHAGTTPMGLRRDASLAAAALVLFVAERAREFAGRGNGHFVATTGVLDIRPNAANVVPGQARMVFDIRAENAALIGEFTAALDAESKVIAARFNVERSRYAVLSNVAPTICDAGLRDLLGRGACRIGLFDHAAGVRRRPRRRLRGADRAERDAVRALP